MATRKAGIAAELSASNDKWKQGLAQARIEAQRFAASLPSIKGQPGFMTGMAGGAQAAGLRFTELAGKVAVAGAVLKSLGVVGEKLQEAAQVEMEFEGAVAGLSAVSDGSETLKAQLEALMVLGEKPGLGFQQVIEASKNLQSVGMNAKQARGAMEEFGNAVAMVGGGKNEFAEVMLVIRKIMSAGKVDMDQLDQISDRIPRFMQIAATLDKTNSRKFVEGAVSALSQLPRAAVTATEAVSNLDDAWKKAMLNTSGGRSVDVIKNASAAAQATMKGDAAGAAKYTAAAAQALVTPKSIIGQYELTPQQIKERAAAKAAADKAAIDAANVKFAKEQNVLDLESELEAAKISGDRQQINAAEERLAIAEKLADVMKDYRLTEEQALTIIRAQVYNEQQRGEAIRAAEKIKENAERKREGMKAAGSTAEDIAIQEARARGQNKKADRMERNRSQQQLRAQLIEQGVNPQQAAALAQRKAQADEDADYFQKTGRRKTRGAVSDNNPIRLGRGFGKEAGFSGPSKLDTANQSGGPGNQTGMTEKLLTEIRDQLLANRPTIAQRTAPRS